MTQETGYSTLGVRFREIRQEFRFNQVEYAIFLGVDQSAISKIERDSSGISLEMADKIITRLHISFDWLLHGTGPKYKFDPTQPGQRAKQWREAVEVVDELLRSKNIRDQLNVGQVSFLVSLVAHGVTPSLPAKDIQKLLGQFVDLILSKARNKEPE